MIQIVTGDDIAIYATLTKDGQTFAIDNGAVVKAAIVSPEHNLVLVGPVTLSNTATGANWATSLVVVEIAGSLTSGITSFRPAILEIEVDDAGELTWFTNLSIVKGLIP